MSDAFDDLIAVSGTFCDRFSKYGDTTVTLFADGMPVEIPAF